MSAVKSQSTKSQLSATWSLAHTARSRQTPLETLLKIVHGDLTNHDYSPLQFQTLWSHISLVLQTIHHDATRGAKHGSNLTDCALDAAGLRRTCAEWNWPMTLAVCAETSNPPVISMLVCFTWPTKRPGGHQSQPTMGQSLYAYSAVTTAIHKGQTQLRQLAMAKEKNIHW